MDFELEFDLGPDLQYQKGLRGLEGLEIDLSSNWVLDLDLQVVWHTLTSNDVVYVVFWHFSVSVSYKNGHLGSHSCLWDRAEIEDLASVNQNVSCSR